MIIDEPSELAASAPTNKGFSYSVKIINPAKKADYSIRKFRVSTLFKTVNSLKEALCEYFPTFLTSSASDVELGYITPGHGARGKQLWISDDIDIEDMYNEYRGKKEIILWFYANNKPDEGSKKGKKRTHSPGEAEHTKRANYRTTAQTMKMEEVEKILKRKTYWGLYRREVESMGSSHPNGETHFLYPAT